MRFKLVENFEVNEEIIRDDDIEMTITDSEYEVKNILKGSSKDLIRIFYDSSIDKYMICDGTKWLHRDMIKKAKANGYYAEVSGFKQLFGNKKVIYISYSPKNSKTAENAMQLFADTASDGYTTYYEYDDGYIFSQEGYSGNLSFKDIGLYTALGNCIKEGKLDTSKMPLVSK